METIMFFSRILTLLCLTAISISACTLSATGQGSDIDTDSVTFHSDWTRSGKVRLTDGEYCEPSAPGSASQTIIKLTEHRAYGRMNGTDAAALVLVTDPGGSGTFYDLTVLIKEKEGWINRANALLGDRIKVHSLAIEDNEIIADITTHGPEDRMCCPTQRVTKRFYLVTGDTLKVKEENGPDVNALAGPVWKWQQSRYNNDTESVPEKPEHYTIEFLKDETVSIRADCNRGGGTYTVDDSRLSIRITHTTMAFCGAESLEKKFIKDLEGAAIFFLKDSALYLDLKYDTGTMRFSR